MKLSGIALLAACTLAVPTEDANGDAIALTANDQALYIYRMFGSNYWLAEVFSIPGVTFTPEKIWYVNDGRFYGKDDNGLHYASVPKSGGTVLFGRNVTADQGFNIEHNTITYGGRSDWYLCTAEDQTYLANYAQKENLPKGSRKCTKAELKIVK